MINLVLLTGFLGSGKTTLMLSILDTFENKKVGLIVNEFGKINIDAVLIKRDGIEMAELSNGSIFCACIKENFLSSLIEMSKRDIEYLFIEASGLADPANMSQILKTIENKTTTAYNYKGSVCIIDAENFLDLYDLLPALHHQVEYSGAVIINKADLVENDIIVDISNKIAQINSDAHGYITSYCKVDIESIINDLNGVYKKWEDTTNTVESRPKTFVLMADECVPFKNLEAFINEISSSAYRIKGFAETDEGSMQISAVGKNVKLTPWTEVVKGAEIVAISSVGIKMLSVITKGIETYLKGQIHF